MWCIVTTLQAEITAEMSSAQSVEAKTHNGAEAAFSDDLSSHAPTEHRKLVSVLCRPNFSLEAYHL